MLTPVKDRKINTESTLSVYRNLHKKCFSIKDKKTGLVISHATNFILSNCICRVSEKGRQRIIRDKRKSVVAVVEGMFHSECELDVSNLQELTFDPYTTPTFINKEDGSEVYKLDLVYFHESKAYILA